jgi:hypothetical protein
MNTIRDFPPVHPPKDSGKIEEKDKLSTESKESLIGKEILSETQTTEKTSSWWNWTLEHGKSFIMSIAGVKEALQEGTNVALKAITYSFNPSSFIANSNNKMTTLTKDPQLKDVVNSIAKKTSAFLWPTHEETIKGLLKQYVPESVFNGVLSFIDVNSEYIGRMIEANIISIIGNLSIEYASAPIDPKLTGAIKDEIEKIMNQMGPFSESAKESVIQKGLGNIKDEFIKNLCPDGIESLEESDPMRLSLEKIEKTLENVPSSVSEKIKQAAVDKENRSQILADITREIFLDPLPSRAPYSALPDLINHFVKTIKDKIDKASEKGENADIKAIIKEFTDEVIDVALPNGIDSLLIPDVGGVVHKAINYWFPTSTLKAMVADLANQAYDKAAEKRDIGAFVESLELPKETTALILPVIKRSLGEELSGSFLEVGKQLFNGLTNPVIEEKNNREILGKELSEQCDKWSAEIMSKVEDPLISMITSAIFGEDVENKDQEARLQLEKQLKVLLKDQDASISHDGSLAWGAAGHVRALLIQAMAKVKQNSKDSPLLSNAYVLAKAVKQAFAKPIEKTSELFKTNHEIQSKKKKIDELKLAREEKESKLNELLGSETTTAVKNLRTVHDSFKSSTHGSAKMLEKILIQRGVENKDDQDFVLKNFVYIDGENGSEGEIQKLESDVLLLETIGLSIEGQETALTEQEVLALNSSRRLPELDNKIEMQTKKLTDLQQQLSKVNLMEIENEIDVQTKELNELRGELEDIDKPNPSADRLVAINVLKREIRELEVNLEFSKTTKQNAKRLSETLTNEIEDLEIELFELGIERNNLIEKTEEGIKALQKRFEGVTEGLLGSIGWGKDDKIAIPFIRDLLKNEILPSLLLDQTKDMILLHVEKAEVEEDLKSHKRGFGAISLGKPIAKLVLDVVKGVIVEPKKLAHELCACYKQIKISTEEMVELEKSIEKLIKHHPGHIKKKELVKLITKIDSALTPDIGQLQKLKDKMNKGFISTSTLGETIGNVLINEELIGMKLTGLSTEQKQSIGQQIKDFLSSKMPEDFDKFLEDHIELMVLKILSNLGKNIAKDGEDILVATAKKFKELSEKYTKEGKEPDIDKITEEILAFADIAEDKSIPGIPKALQSLLYGLAKAEVGRRLKDLYAKRALSKDSAHLQEIRRSVEQKIHRPGKKEEEQIKLDILSQQIGEIGTQITFDLLLKDRKDEGNIINFLKENILPTEGSTELGESLLEVWDAFSEEEKTMFEENAKSHLTGLVSTTALEGLGNLFSGILKETRSFSIAKITSLLKVVTDLLTEKPALTKIGPKTRKEAEAGATFFHRLASPLLKILLPDGAKSKALESIPEEYRQIAWTQLKTNILPLILKGICNYFLSEKGLKALWISILQSINKRLAVEKFDLEKAKIRAQEKKRIEQEEQAKLKMVPEGGKIAENVIAPTGNKKVNLSPDEQSLDTQAGEAFMAITDKFAPGLKNNFLVRMIVSKEKIPELVGSALRGMITDTSWIDMIEPVIPKTIEKGVKANEEATEKSMEELNTGLKEELGKAIGLGWQALHSIINNAIYEATGTLGYGAKQAVDKAVRLVLLTIIGTVMKGLFGIQTDAIKQRLISKGMEVVDFSVALFDTEEKRRKVISKITNVFIPFEQV